MKHYIVANKKQELEVLGKLEEAGFMWVNSHKLPTEVHISEFPYVVIADNNKNNAIMWSAREVDFERNVVYDGRKEEKMTNKYKVTQEFMDKLVEWRDKQCIDVTRGYGFVYHDDLAKVPPVVKAWWLYDNAAMECNSRLITIISWLNGEYVFEVEEPHKFVVRSDSADKEGGYWYVFVREDTGGSPSWPSNGLAELTYIRDYATEFNTYEEAKEWANSHQVVIEVDEEGNEV